MIDRERSDDDSFQNLVKNGHKRKNEPNYKVDTTTDRILLYVDGPVEGWCSDYLLYSRSD